MEKYDVPGLDREPVWEGLGKALRESRDRGDEIEEGLCCRPRT